jgi:outer membrane protein OmpA-like peptidoglycan-associated protein
MIKILYILFLYFFSASLFSQANYPNNLPIKSISIITNNHLEKTYDLTLNEKKIFIFFDSNTESMAELLYNGCKFIFEKDKFITFPIYFSGELTKKTSKNFESLIPTQIYRTPLKSIFKEFGIKDFKYPLLFVFNEDNTICGVAKNVEELANLNCDLAPVKSKFLRLKILTEELDKSQKPYAYKPIVILGGLLNDTIAKLTTNQYGDFDGILPSLKQDYIIVVNEKIKNINFVILSTQSGKKIGNFNSTQRGFEYRILQLDLNTLPDFDVDDNIEMKFSKLNLKQDFIVTENLFYELGTSSISEESKVLLGKISQVLANYPNFILEVISHTDSKGDENSNLKLSIKRSEEVKNYLIQNGIEEKRVTAIGKGEQEIRNRCVNNIDCSDVEHEYNRRTEFKFIKK